MMIKTGFPTVRVTTFTLICFLVLSSDLIQAQSKSDVFPGADENTPSKAEYFSWINNTNEGPTEEHTLINFEFFEWMKSQYGMQMDIYAFDAGTIDGKRFYGSIYSDRFKEQFPNGFDPIYKEAQKLGMRLGVWGGPDGFGNTPEEEKARINQMVRLCKEYNFELFKFDAVAGYLRPNKEDAFIEMMKRCRKHSPNLILLNHRLGLNNAKPYATTSLWEGSETYIDVFMSNSMTASHHRAQAISRGLPSNLKRLTEDHGVALTSYLDYWDDDLVLQAFNRSFILAPQIYGNPWLLPDEDFPKLSRIFNIHRKYREILVNGKMLPGHIYGPSAVSRGNDNTRLITLRNLTWNDTTYAVKLTEEIGLKKSEAVTVRQFHPTEKIVGEYSYGDEVKIDVSAFRSNLLLVTNEEVTSPAVYGSDFEIIQDVPGQPVKMKLLGLPGTTSKIRLANHNKYQSAKIAGDEDSSLLNGKQIEVDFSGEKLTKDYHRFVGSFTDTAQNPADSLWKSLYEATIFSADNNALEVRAFEESGPTSIPEVKKARDAFFNQEVFVQRGIWDKNLFDGDLTTGFWPSKKYGIDQTVKGGSFRIDIGEIQKLDSLVIHVPDEFSLHPLLEDEGNHAEVSSDLKEWKRVLYLAGERNVIELKQPIRYIRLKNFPSQIMEVEGFRNGKSVDRDTWRASNLFAHPDRLEAHKLWKKKFKLNEIAKNSYLSVALNGEHGQEGAYVAAKVDGEFVGAPDRAQAYPSNTWEYVNSRTDENYTYYIPVDKSMEGKQIELFVMAFNEEHLNFKPEVWLSAYPIPYREIEVTLKRK